MEEEGIIQNYYTVIDSFRLGYFVLRFYIVYQYITQDIEQEIINYFKNSKYTWVVDSIQGEFDLSVIIWIKNIKDFFNFWSKTLNKFGDYFQNQTQSFFIQAISYRSTYLLGDKKRLNSEKFDITGFGDFVKINELDFRILQLISSNARMPVTEIAHRVNSTSAQVHYRLDKLKRLNIIQGFRVNLDIVKLGYKWFKIDIQLKEYMQRNKIINYIKQNPNLLCIMTSTGLSHLEFEFHLKNTALVYDTMMDIINKFPNAVRNYTYFSVRKAHKLSYMPEE